jgi:hypothetical protein
MKKKFAKINALLMIAVLFSMLFQSADSYAHLAKQLSEKHCVHESKSGQNEITHQHHFDDCFVCKYTFSPYLSLENFSFEVLKKSISSQYFVRYSKQITTAFPGSLFALRAPPLV